MAAEARFSIQPDVSYLPYRFNAGRWVDRDQFYGRVALLRDVLNDLAESVEPQQRRFIGRRRQGKTSMLHAVGWLASCAHQRHLIPNRAGLRPPEDSWTLLDLAYELEREGVLDAVFETQGKPILPIYVDVRTVWRAKEFAYRIAQRIDAATRQHAFVRRLQAGQRLSDGLCDVLNEIGETHRVVLLLDECGAIVPGRPLCDDPEEFATQTASLIRLLDEIQLQPDRPPHLYIAASRDLDLLASGPLKQLIDNMPVFPIGNLPPEAVDAMLARSGLAEPLCEEVRQRCGGNPFYVQVLGHAHQNSLADAVTQIRAGIENDLEHVSEEELRWLTSLVNGSPERMPQTAPVLGRCGYVTQIAGQWRLREGLMQEFFGAGVPVGPIVKVEAPKTTQVTERFRIALRRYESPTRQKYGQLELRAGAPINLGAQNYLLLYLLCEARRTPDLALQVDEAKYPMFLALALCGADHGYLNPRGLLSNLRKALREGVEDDDESRTSWLPKGRGGYRLGDELDVVVCDHPFGHIRSLRRLDLVRAYQVWAKARATFVEFLREAGAGGRGQGLRMIVRATEDEIFPNHPYVAHLEVYDVSNEVVSARLGPIPLTDPQATAFRHWRDIHDDGEGVIALGALERELKLANLEPVAATELCRPFDVLGLRDGGSFVRDGRRWSSEWLPQPDTPADFPTAPRWLDLSMLNLEGGAPYTVEQLLRDLDED